MLEKVCGEEVEIVTMEERRGDRGARVLVVELSGKEVAQMVLQSKDGTTIWKAKPSNASISATPIVHETANSVLLGTLDGTCVSLNQTTGKILWIRHLKHPIFSAPVISHNQSIIFCDVSGVVAAFDLKDGKQIWKMDIGGNVFSHLVIQKDRATAMENLIIPSRNRNLYIFRIESHTTQPKLRNQIEFSSPIIATPWVDDNFIIIALVKGELMIINSVSSGVDTMYKFQDEVYSSPVVHEDFLAIGCRDNNLYILLRE
ncbi:beta-alanine-activating enzyme isoform X1 [Diachasma alloeum]|uniref:beta-alanine-activating enzyme isoform X1 n=1 Tax=Diachasma alloeum TaxID=454923 RepID=UPI0010FB4F78|nr:beta-alanine-activating enzyme isoform X1 [Diachasma alloeum]